MAKNREPRDPGAADAKGEARSPGDDHGEGGKPRPKDAIDPELMSIRGPRLPIGMVTAAAMLIFCVVLLIRLRHDLTFSRAGEARPVTIADIVAGKVDADSFVTLIATPDVVEAIRVRPSEATPGTRVTPALGSGDGLWLALPGDPWAPVGYQPTDSAADPDSAAARTADPASAPPLEDIAIWTRCPEATPCDEPRAALRYRGRLRRLDDVRLGEPALDAIGKRPTPRVVTGDELRHARTASATGGTVTTSTGDPITVTATSVVEAVVADPAAAHVIATFDGGSLADAAAWSAALAAAGVVDAGATPTRVEGRQATFAVRRPDAVAVSTRALEAAGLWAARVEPVTQHHRAAWRDLAVDDTGVRFGDAVVPWRAVDFVAIDVTRKAAPGAWILLVGETPGQYWYVVPLYVVLVTFAGLFVWALARAVRRQLIVAAR